ncbi:MAG: methionine--tRNA ligase subunit beta [Planctomycetota bacterium]
MERRKANVMSEQKPTITFDDFLKLDIRIANVVEVGDHPNADKLIVLKIDLGGEQRQIIAGLKGYYAPEELLGKQIVVIANLEPRKMRGMESQAMLLAATPGEGEAQDVVILTPDKEVPAGSGVS